MVPQAAIAGSAVPKVLVSAAPLKPMADALLNGITQSTVLVHAGQDLHGMVLSPSQSRALDRAEIITLPDRDLSPIITKLAERSNADVIYLTDLPGADPLPYATQQRWLGETREAEKLETLRDPHLWLDPLRMATIAIPLAEAMARHAPSQRARLVNNAKSWQLHVINALHPGLQKILAAPKKVKRYSSRPFIPFITDHSAYQYFLMRYEIENYGALISRPEEYLGAASRKDVLTRAKEIHIGCVIAEQDTPLVKRIARDSAARLVRHNPEMLMAGSALPALRWLKDDYDRLLYQTAVTFRDCL